MRIPLSHVIAGSVLACSAAFLAGCSGPFYLWDSHSTSTPRSQSFDPSTLAYEPVAALAVVAPPALQGLSPSVSHALTTALSYVSPPIRGIPTYETMNRLNEKGLAAEYTGMISDFARSGILDRERLHRIGSALGFRYVFQPGLADFSQTLTNRLDLVGWKVLNSRVSTLRLWLQLWDTQSGQMLWESAGEVMVASEVIRDQTVPLSEMAKKLWARMIQDDLLGGGTKSEFFSMDRIFGDDPKAPQAGRANHER